MPSTAPTHERVLRRGDYIHGSFIKPESIEGYLNASNPGDRRDVLGRFPFSVRSIDDAVEAAQAGTRTWRRVGLMDRAAIIGRFREAIAAHAEPLASLLVRESGRPLWECRQEVAASVRAIDAFLDDGLGLIAPRVMEDISGRSDHVPRGVVGLLLPSSMPLFNGVVGSVAGVLGGNGVVMKPSKYAPVIGQAVAEAWDKAKLPRGTFNLVQGPGSVVGQRLVAHAGLDALVHTGSYDTAREVRRALAERPELTAVFQSGGKALAIVCEDAPKDRAVYEIVVGAFLSAGQRPTSTARAIIVGRAWDAIVPEIVRRAQRVRVGYGFDDDIFMGPLSSETARTRFRRYCRALTAKGHVALLEGDVMELSNHRGNYVTPGVYKINHDNGAPFLNEEPPGPLLLLYKAKDIDEAIDLHNRAVYRPVTSVFTRPDNTALADIREQLKTGGIHVNRSTIGSSVRLPASPQGRAGNGLAGAIDLVRALTFARASTTEGRRFEPARVVPGLAWSEDDDGTMEWGPMELRVE